MVPRPAAHGQVDRAYDVVAMSIPIVYTLEGDHDPNGMAYVLKPLEPLLEWARARWHDQDELLPTLQFRRQRVQLVVDGLERLELMIDRLLHGPEDDQALLAELIRAEELPAYAEPDDRLRHGDQAQGGRAAAVRTNVERQLASLRQALKDLRVQDPRTAQAALDQAATPAGEAAAPARAAELADAPAPLTLAATDPKERRRRWQAQQALDRLLARELAADAMDGEPAFDDDDDDDAEGTTEADDAGEAEAEPRLVTLSPAERQQWRSHWTTQAALLDEAIAQALRRIDRLWDGDAAKPGAARELMKGPGAPDESWIRRLLLNDHRPGTGRDRPCDRFNPLKPIPALRPLVLRCREGETVAIRFENSLQRRRVGFHVQGGRMRLVDPGTSSCIPGDGVRHADGASIGRNHDSTCPPQTFMRLEFDARGHQGVWPINDLADVRGGEDGSNAHGLFGAIVVEPPGVTWHDPETGADLTDAPWCSLLDVSVHAPAGEDVSPERRKTYVDFHRDPAPRSFREFTVFIHDEPEVHSGLHTAEHALMPLSYRAEPMHNRLPHRMRDHAKETLHRPLPSHPDAVDRRAVMWTLGDELDEQFFTARNGRGEWLERVAGEEQHHSSWLFGDPVTHIQRAYAGDPCRVRLVHAGVKETHVYHLHVHQWRAVASDTAAPSVHGCDAAGAPKSKGSQLLDSVTIGPQSAMTIDPLYGSGSRQNAIGDVIWHCHLYPHFHHGMWGLWRSYSHRVDGSRPYPDGSRCPPLHPLPGHEPLVPTAAQPGFPWFIDGEYPMKSPPPPVPGTLPMNGRRVLLRMPRASTMEWAAMPPACRDGSQSGAVFVDLDGQAREWFAAAGLPVHPRIISYDVEVLAAQVTYNVQGWHDPRGHFYRLQRVEVRVWSGAANGGAGGYVVDTSSSRSFAHAADHNPEPFFPRANQGDIVEWRQHSSLKSFPADKFDLGQLPVEVGLHVHLVKFDPLASDGSATGWNYLSGASCREAVGADGVGELRTVSLHRWVVDEEFGPCFFHDHLLANFRQKHGLFAALIAQPHGSQWTRVDDQGERAWSEPQAVVLPPASSGLPPYREACLGICDFVALLDAGGRALNPPGELSGDDDPGSMAVNYRSAPLTFRGRDPSQWFSSQAQSQTNLLGVRGDPDTPLIQTYPGERLRIRLVQGSHEEQHGFALHGMRWRRDWGNATSPLANQQTLGISEAFTLDVDPGNGDSPYGIGDHLYHFCAMDDVWLGCWGIVRSLPPVPASHAHLAPLPGTAPLPAARSLPARVPEHVRSFVIAARRIEHAYAGRTLTDPWGLVYQVLEHVDPHDAKAGRCLSERLQHWQRDDAGENGAREEFAMKDAPTTPLVLRARRGEWVRIILLNELLDEDDDEPEVEDDGQIAFGVEPSPARLPLEHLDELFRPDERTVSPRVSLHASLLCYDVRHHDGSYVGDNPDSTVGTRRRAAGAHGGHAGPHDEDDGVVHRPDHHGRRHWREYWWYVDEKLAPASHHDVASRPGEVPGQVCFLHDMADLRNHRHHGLIGALVALPGDVTPFALRRRTRRHTGGGPSNRPAHGDGWHGLSAEIRDAQGKTLAHDTAIFVQDGLRFFVNGHPDYPMPDAEPGDDPEDSGQKAVNYRSHPVQHGRVSREDTSVFPSLTLPGEGQVWLRLIGAGDKPRQHTMAIHGCAWPAAPWAAGSERIGALTGLSPCRVENIALALPKAGDYAVRAGGFRWASEHGVWASIRVGSGP